MKKLTNYAAPPHRHAVLDKPNKAPGAEGTIAINTDIDNTGKAVDIYEIKVSVGE